MTRRNIILVLSDDHRYDFMGFMKESAEKTIGTKYDYGQLINIALSNVFGEDFEYKIKLFDMGSEKRVCSVGIRANFEHARKKINKVVGSVVVKRLFNELRRDFWTGKEYEKFERVDVENTCPALFVNSKYFDSEFKTIARV